MKNYSSSQKKIDVGNIFALNRLGLSDILINIITGVRLCKTK